jgi:hypothetical protein
VEWQFRDIEEVFVIHLPYLYLDINYAVCVLLTLYFYLSYAI